MNIPDAPPALAPLLRRLFNEADTGIGQHKHDPRPDAWYAGRGDAGDFGPYPSAEDAIVGVLRHLWRGLDEVCAERDAAEAEARQLRVELDRIRAEARDAVALLEKLQGEQGPR